MVPTSKAMFDIKTCPTCEGVLAPGSDACPSCSDPGPEVADPWSLGTPEAVSEARTTPPPPTPGSQLAGKPSKPATQGMSTGAKVAIGIGVTVLVLGAIGVVAAFFVGQWLLDEAGDAFVEGFAEQTGATEGLDQFQFAPTYSLAGLSVGECYSLEADRPVPADCSGPHYYEVYHQFEAPGDAYPSTFDLDETCYAAFEAFVGVDYWDSAYFSDTVLPTEAEWGSGERTVTCALNEPFTELTGSAVGTAR